MPLKVCSFGGCNAVVEVPHDNNSTPRCELHSITSHTPKREYAHHYHQGKKIYSSARWVALRNQYSAHQPLCERCLAIGIVKPGYAVDHIKEIEDDGDVWEWSNLQHLCQACHNTKTARERNKRQRRKKNNGFGSLSDF